MGRHRAGDAVEERARGRRIDFAARFQGVGKKWVSDGGKLLSRGQLPALCPHQPSLRRPDPRERRLRLPAFLGGVLDADRGVTAGARRPLECQPLLTGPELREAACDRQEVAVSADGAWLVGSDRDVHAPHTFRVRCPILRFRLVLK